MVNEETLVHAVADDERRRHAVPYGSRGSGPAGHGGWSAGRTARQRELYSISGSDLERLADGEAITGRPDGWGRGQVAQLEGVRKDIDRARERKRERWRARVPPAHCVG